VNSGESTRVGGTEINLPAVRGANDDLLDAIFGPAFSAIGQQLADDVRRFQADDLSDKERQKLRRQTERVFGDKAADAPQEPTGKRRRNLVDWIEEASETEPENDQAGAAK
jgi:hypothetical protein